MSLYDTIQSHVKDAMQNLHTTMPGKIIKVHKVENTTVVDVLPLINSFNNTGEYFEHDVLLDLTIKWPSGGGAYMTFPIKAGDLVELRFSMFSRDEYDYSDGVKPVNPSAKRRHSLSDAVAIPGDFTYKTGPEVVEDAIIIKGAGEGTEIKIGDDGDITVKAENVKIEGAAKVTVDAGTIELGEGATEAVVLGTTFLTLYNAHTHPVSGALAGTTTSPMAVGTHTSEVTTTK